MTELWATVIVGVAGVLGTMMAPGLTDRLQQRGKARERWRPLFEAMLDMLAEHEDWVVQRLLPGPPERDSRWPSYAERKKLTAAVMLDAPAPIVSAWRRYVDATDDLGREMADDRSPQLRDFLGGGNVLASNLLVSIDDLRLVVRAQLGHKDHPDMFGLTMATSSERGAAALEARRQARPRPPR